MGISRFLVVAMLMAPVLPAHASQTIKGYVVSSANKPDVISLYRKAEKKPDDIAAHMAFINACLAAGKPERLGNTSLVVANRGLYDLYEAWAQEVPSLQWARMLQAGLNIRNSPVNTRKLFGLAGSQNPALGKYFSTEFQKYRQSDPARAFDLAAGIRTISERDYRVWLMALADEQKGAAVGLHAQVLLSEIVLSEQERIGFLESIRKNYRQYANHGSEADLAEMDRESPQFLYEEQMRALFDSYLRSDSDAALGLAVEMAEASPRDTRWTTSAAIQRWITQADDRVDGSMLPFVANTEFQLAMMKARMDGNGYTIYKELVQAYAIKPAATLRDRIFGLAKSLVGKDRATVQRDLGLAPADDAASFRDFQLQTYDGKQVALRDLKGKAVLVTFWFPTCVGCLEEFPFLQRLARDVGEKLQVVAINMFPDQDGKAAPTLAKYGQEFIFLRVPTDVWAKQTYDVTYAPRNFLISPKGELVGEPYARNAAELEALTLKVRNLVQSADIAGNAGNKPE